MFLEFTHSRIDVTNRKLLEDVLSEAKKLKSESARKSKGTEMGKRSCDPIVQTDHVDLHEKDPIRDEEDSTLDRLVLVDKLCKMLEDYDTKNRHL